MGGVGWRTWLATCVLAAVAGVGLGVAYVNWGTTGAAGAAPPGPQGSPLPAPRESGTARTTPPPVVADAADPGTAAPAGRARPAPATADRRTGKKPAVSRPSAAREQKSSRKDGEAHGREHVASPSPTPSSAAPTPTATPTPAADDDEQGTPTPTPEETSGRHG